MGRVSIYICMEEEGEGENQWRSSEEEKREVFMEEEGGGEGSGSRGERDVWCSGSLVTCTTQTHS